MTNPTDFAKLVPGFDFMQNLMKSAGQGLPNLNQWIAPTLDPEEINKRIEQLKTVQFWLEQNSRMLSASIQALEVQRMTLATLNKMNMPMDSLRNAFSMKLPQSMAPLTAAAEPAPAPKAAPRKPRATANATGATQPSAAAAPGHASGASSAGSAASAGGLPDPMQWWGALTQQFGELAANALKDTGAEAAKKMAGDLSSAAFKGVMELPGAVANAAAGAAKSAVLGKRAKR